MTDGTKNGTSEINLMNNTMYSIEIIQAEGQI